MQIIMINKFLQNPLKLVPVLLFIPFIVLSAACSSKGGGETSDTAAHAEFDRKLNALKVDVNIAHFNQLLGEPISKEQRNITRVRRVLKPHGRPRTLEENFTFNEYFYVNDAFYVQAVADENDKVGMYSITARKASYRPAIETLLGQTVHLGKSTYADLQKAPRKIAADLSDSANPTYYEILVTAGENPPLVVFATSPVGHKEKLGTLEEAKAGVFVKWFSLTGRDFPLHEQHDSFRKNTSFNTYAVAAPWFRGLNAQPDGANLGAVEINFGPRAGQFDKD